MRPPEVAPAWGMPGAGGGRCRAGEDLKRALVLVVIRESCT